MTKRITKADVLKMVAQKLPQPFTSEQLTVEAWKINNQMFGLIGYSDKYPNNNITLTALMGKSGLVAKGSIRRVGVNLYQCP